MAMPRLQGRWCPSCGAAVGWDDEVCPSCGLPLEDEWGSPATESGEQAEGEQAPTQESDPKVDETSDTRAIPRIESAIPPEDDSESRVKAQEKLPKTRVFLVAALAASLVIYGLVVFVTRPWQEDQGNGRATVEADTSVSGFPGTVDSLSGQDSSAVQDGHLTGDELAFSQLTECYDKLGKYAERAGECEAQFDSLAYDPQPEIRTQGKRSVDLLAIDIGNLKDFTTAIDVSSGVYVQEKERMLSLCSWLGSRVDTLAAAWKVSYESQDPAADADLIRQTLAANDGEDGLNAYKVLFETNYGQWRPQHASNG